MLAGTVVGLAVALAVSTVGMDGAAAAEAKKSATRPAAKKFPSLALLPAVSVPADNPMSPEKVELGKKLFFDSRLSVRPATF